MTDVRPETKCACPDCTYVCSEKSESYRNGKLYCSQACADMHPEGLPCPADNCGCERGVQSRERNISDAKLDESIEETFPASDPISP
jgi:hypothetical protein